MLRRTCVHPLKRDPKSPKCNFVLGSRPVIEYALGRTDMNVDAETHAGGVVSRCGLPRHEDVGLRGGFDF